MKANKLYTHLDNEFKLDSCKDDWATVSKKDLPDHYVERVEDIII